MCVYINREIYLLQQLKESMNGPNTMLQYKGYCEYQAICHIWYDLASSHIHVHAYI